MKKVTISTIFLFLFLCQTLSTAQPEANDSTKSLIFSGNIDMYYRYGFNKTASSTSPSSNHGLGLGWVNLAVEKKWKKISLFLDAAAGPRTPQLYENETDGTFLTYIKQVYIAYAPTEKLTLTFGALTSHFNFEYTEPFDNFTYSNSMIFTVIPASYTGFKAEYALTDKWQLMLGLFSDSNIKIDRNKGKHLGAQLAYADDKFTFTSNLIAGRDGDTTHIMMNDYYADYAFTDKFKLGLQFHIMTDKPVASAKNNIWFGTALYANYQMTKKFLLGFRGERLNDADAYWFGETDAKIWSWTLAGQYLIGNNFKIEPEIRYDTSNKNIFPYTENGNVKTEPSFILAALYKF